MFEKLLATLPYNPGLAHQVAFYGRRMREEAVIRRTGLIFIVLAFFIQFFAVISPPQPTVAASNNDLINGGISGIADARNKCNNNVQHFKNVLATYGIDCAAFNNPSTKVVTIQANGQNFYSFGRVQQGFSSEQPVHIDNLGTLYIRKLADWGPTARYQAVQVTASTGKNFWIIFNCGNLVSIGIPQPVNPCRYNPNIPASSPQCFNKCQYNPNIPASSPECYNKCQYNPAIPASSPQCYNKCPYNGALKASDPNCRPPTSTTTTTPVCQYNPALPPNSPDCKPAVCKYNAGLPPDSPDCKPCDKQVSSENQTACVAVHKTGSNITTGTADANNTEAKAGDVITYTLFAQNNGKETVKDYLFTEDLSDVLDYATVTDLHGGTISETKVVTWPKQDIKVNDTATVKVTVKILDPVPQTPVGSSDPTRFDLNMTNIYGNTVNIRLPGSPQKTVEGAAATLPNTGPGTTLMIGGAIVIGAGYFFSRARLLAKESTIALKETAVGAV